MQKKTMGALVALALWVGSPAGTCAGEIEGEAGYDKGIAIQSKDELFAVKIGSRVQVLFTQTDPDEATGVESTGSFDIRRAKLGLSGHVYGDWKFKIQAVWSGDATELEDAYFQYTRNPLAQLWVGQGKVLFGRQQLTSSGKQQFVDRSIIDGEFHPARSQGIALIGVTESKKFEYSVGVYDDFDGQNVPTNSNDKFLYTGRVVYTPFGPYKLAESSLDYPDSSRLAVGLKALSDTTGMEATEADNRTIGLEVAYKIRGFNLVGEYYDRSIEPVAGDDVDSDGFYLQAGYLLPNRKMEFAARYATVHPDVPAGAPGADRTESGVAFSYYLDGHDYKVQADYRRLEEDTLVGGLADTLEDDEIRVQLQIAF